MKKITFTFEELPEAVFTLCREMEELKLLVKQLLNSDTHVEDEKPFTVPKLLPF